MKHIAFLAGVGVLSSITLLAADLTSEQKLKKENFELKVQNAQLLATLQDRENRLRSVELSQERADLLADFSKTLNCADGEAVNWQTLTCEAPKTAKADVKPESTQ